MKTPNKIKKGLECLVRGKYPNAYCGGCPYHENAAQYLHECKSPEIITDALALIQQLEEHIGFLNEILQEEVYRKDAAIADIDMVCPCEICTRSCKYDKVNAYSECADFEWRGPNR